MSGFRNKLEVASDAMLCFEERRMPYSEKSLSLIGIGEIEGRLNVISVCPSKDHSPIILPALNLIVSRYHRDPFQLV